MSLIFVSYRKADAGIGIDLLRDRFIQTFGASRVFFDDRSIREGSEWRQRIEAALEEADVVVMLHAREWAGGSIVGQRRIDDPADVVRYELVRARELGTPIVPLLIDQTPYPTAEQLPENLRFLADIHYRAYKPGGNALVQIDDFIRDRKESLLGERPIARYLLHGAWIAWVCVSIVFMLQGLSMVSDARDAFDRTVQTVAYLAIPPVAPGADTGSDLAVVAISTPEFHELFGGRTPLDPDVLSLVLDVWRDRSIEAGACGETRPIGIALEMAPGEGGADARAYASLGVSLRRLAACRPVVIACPQNMSEPEPFPANRAWLQALAAPPSPERKEKPVFFASGMLDADVLRLTVTRSELGAAVGELAATGKPSDWIDPQKSGHAECICPIAGGPTSLCDRGEPTQLDPRSLIRLQPRVDDRNLVDSLQGSSQIVMKRELLLGGAFSGQTAMSVPSSRVTAPVPSIDVHAYEALSVGSRSWRTPPGVDLVFSVVAAAVGAGLLMICWRDIASHPMRYSRRFIGYSAVITVSFGIPAALAGFAAWQPGTLGTASLAATSFGLVVLRCALAGGEILLARADDWRPFDLRRNWGSAFAPGPHRVAARLRLCVIALEGTVGIAGLLYACRAGA